MYVRGCSPEHFLFTRAFPTRSFASPGGLYKEVFLACSLHSVVRAFFTRSRSRSRFASLSSALLAPLLFSCLTLVSAPLVPRLQPLLSLCLASLLSQARHASSCIFVLEMLKPLYFSSRRVVNFSGQARPVMQCFILGPFGPAKIF